MLFWNPFLNLARVSERLPAVTLHSKCTVTCKCPNCYTVGDVITSAVQQSVWLTLCHQVWLGKWLKWPEHTLMFRSSLYIIPLHLSPELLCCYSLISHLRDFRWIFKKEKISVCLLKCACFFKFLHSLRYFFSPGHGSGTKWFLWLSVTSLGPTLLVRRQASALMSTLYIQATVKLYLIYSLKCWKQYWERS